MVKVSMDADSTAPSCSQDHLEYMYLLQISFISVLLCIVQLSPFPLALNFIE